MEYIEVFEIQSLPIQLKNALETLRKKGTFFGLKNGKYGIEMKESGKIPLGWAEPFTGREEIYQDEEIAKLNNKHFSATVDFCLQSFFGSGVPKVSFNEGDPIEFYRFVSDLKREMYK